MRNWNSEHTEAPLRKGAGGSPKRRPQLPPAQPRPKCLLHPVTVPRHMVLAPRLLATVPSTSSRRGPFLPPAPTSTSRKDLLSPRLGCSRNLPVGPERTQNCLPAELPPSFDEKRQKPSLPGKAPRSSCPQCGRLPFYQLRPSVRPTSRASAAPGLPAHSHTCTPLSATRSHSRNLWPPPRAPPHQDGRDNKSNKSAVVRVMGDGSTKPWSAPCLPE